LGLGQRLRLQLASLTWLSHMVDCGLYGLNPAAIILRTSVLHAANAMLVFLL